MTSYNIAYRSKIVYHTDVKTGKWWKEEIPLKGYEVSGGKWQTSYCNSERKSEELLDFRKRFDKKYPDTA